jgi:hypothetical protein
MRILRWLAAGLIGTVGAVLGLVGALLCVTLILIPLGIPVLMLSRRVFGLASRIVVPRSVRHPVKELDRRSSDAAGSVRKKARRGAGSATDAVSDAASSTRKTARRKAKRLRKLKPST